MKKMCSKTRKTLSSHKTEQSHSTAGVSSCSLMTLETSLSLWQPSWHKILDNFLKAPMKEMAMQTTLPVHGSLCTSYQSARSAQYAGKSQLN